MIPPNVRAGEALRALLVVESPTRALALRRVVGPSVRVLATAGNVFDSRGNPRRGGGRVLQELQAAARVSDRVLVATDPDREGEAIAAGLLRFLAPSFPGRVTRVHLDEDSAAGVARALAAPRSVDRGRVAARSLREDLDRAFLAASSRVLGEAGPCGRVRASALARVVDRTAEAPSRWQVEVALLGAGGRVKAAVEPALPDRAAAEALAAAIAGTVPDPAAVARERREEPPPPPFDTAALLAEADRLGLGPERVLDAARALHRGVELADGVEPLLTYPRTDEATLEEGRDRAGKPLAHGGIRPVSAAWPPEQAAPFLAAAERKVYERVWRRTAAARAGPAVLEAIEVELAVGEGRIRARAVRVIEPGWRAVEEPGWRAVEEPGWRAVEEPGAAVAVGAGASRAVRFGRARVVECPGPGAFRPGELIADLAAHGIGRPSTWATIAAGLREAGWVRGDGGRLRATDEGRRIDAFLRGAFGVHLSADAARATEAALREVEEGRLSAAEFRRRFVAPLAAVGGPRGPRCPACGRPLVGGGPCAGFPLCRGSG